MYVLFFNNVDYGTAFLGQQLQLIKISSQTPTETICYSSTFLRLHFSSTVCGTQYPKDAALTPDELGRRAQLEIGSLVEWGTLIYFQE